MNKKWWHDKVVYQIYPKSFCDSNGDGIGDIPGIISKLDYLHDLGVDMIWLSPCYCSPMADQGYDISDYYNIDPCFGTMEDMDHLIAEAKKRDMYILMDLVVNHCSDEHEWFKKACQDPEGKYGKFFYLADKKEGQLPTNWRSYFGGPAWDDLPGTDKQYLHVFHKKQPDLNWENPELREEIYKMINWWLDKGLGGFRIDAILNIKKAFPFHDYEPDREDGLSSIGNMLAEAKGVGVFLREMRDRTFRLHDAFSVGEVFSEKREDTVDFIGEEDGYFSSMFDFNESGFGRSEKGWYDSRDITPDDYKNRCFETQKLVKDIGFISNIIENHDQPRGASHYIPDNERNPESKKMLGALNFFLKGIPFLYQGQELGMENTVFSSIGQVDDVSSIDEYQVALDAGFTPEEALKIVNKYSRDNGRTPMHWTAGPQAGFTTGTPWLPLNPDYPEINAEDQLKDDRSVWHFYQEMIALRKNPEYKETFVYGELVPAWEDIPRLMAYHRKGEKDLLVIGNFQNEERELTLPGSYKKLLLNNYDSLKEHQGTLTLKGHQLVVFEM